MRWSVVRRWVGTLVGGLGLAWTGVAADRISLSIPGGDGGPPVLSFPAATNALVVLESSADLVGWREWLRSHGPVGGVPDRRSPADATFYRAQTRPLGPGDDAKNLLTHPGDGFRSPEVDPWRQEVRWVKFAILLSEPHRVWFQDSTRYPFHYDFARARLPGFSGMTRAEFDAVTLRTNRQAAVLGAVLIPPAGVAGEVGIQFVGLDPFAREDVAGWFETVRAMIQRPPGVEVLYLPTFEQAEVARRHAEWFAERGILVSRAGRWVTGDECYASGWALGRLVMVSGGQIAEAYRSGALGPQDILLTDAVPAEVPPLAGIVTLTPATPNSHVALLARSFGIPFVHLTEAAQQEEARGWTNRDVLLRAVQAFDGCALRFSAVEGPLDADLRERILALQAPPRLAVRPKRATGRLSLPADELHPSDIDRVGGKAANFGVLRRAIPAQSPSPALAFTLDLWDGYLDQDLGAGRGSLRAAVASRLAGFSWPPDMAALQTALAEVREWIEDDADFTAPQREAILGALEEAGFDPLRKIRFRSSTNVEDSEQFSGAGLYDSYSGCLADDLDADGAGPSACDPTEARERGVFRALRKVLASFYNDNAYLERLRHQVDERDVGMAVLVHYSTPDVFELANGVAALRVHTGTSRLLNGELVTQLGAVSVANPDATAVPETVTLFQSGGIAQLSVERRSSLVPLGDTVMDWDADYRALTRALDAAAAGYAAEFPERTSFHLDFEYKKVAPGDWLMVKQVREIPSLPERTYRPPWCLATEDRFEVVQGEFGDVLANHRLKSFWRFRVKSQELTDANLATSPILDLQGEWNVGGVRESFGGAPASLPDYAYRRHSEALEETWSVGSGAARRDLQLSVQRIRETRDLHGPLLTWSDHPLALTVRYATPQPTLGWDPVRGTTVSTNTRQEVVRLGAVSPVTGESLRQERTFTRGSVVIHTVFWWPPPPTGPTAGYTAPVQAWEETTIHGLTRRPIVLRSPWAQTYRPGHHNFFEEFAFEPRLDPAVPADLLAELEAANIRAIVLGGDPEGRVDFGFFWGRDDVFRPW